MPLAPELYKSNSVGITGGAIDGTAIGGTTPAAGTFTTLNTTGDVGIGVTDPDEKLEVNGNIHLSADNNYISFGAAGSADSTIKYTGTQLEIAASGGLSELNLTGTESTVATKNKTTTYLSDAVGDYLIYQPYYWNGSDWVSTKNYGFGHSALQNNTGANSNGIGNYALYSNTGAYSNGFGYSALRYNTGAYSNGFGYQALYNNTGAFSNGFGHSALQNNTGTNNTGFGYQALQNNTGAFSNGFGSYALRYNTGAYSNGFGYSALQNNTGANSTGFGRSVLYSNTGANSTGLGYQALRYNQGYDNIAIGDNAWSTFLTNAGGAKTFDNTDIDIDTDRVTVTTHGFGANGTYINLTYTQGTSAITGLTNAVIYQVKIIDANTIGFYEADGPAGASRGTNITAAGTGTGHTLTPQYTYDNSICIGADTVPTASNQVTLGNSSTTETLLSGNVGIEVAAPTAKLHVDQASTSAAIPVLTVDQADVSEEFIRFIGTSTTDDSQSLIDAADMTTPGAIAGWLKIYVQDDQATNPITDGAYYVPFYSAPTA